MSADTVTHQTKVWIWQDEGGPASWHFVTFDGDAGEAIAAHEAERRLSEGLRRGFGSVKVEARIGETAWRTSVFPHKSRAGWLLPLKKAVRSAEGIDEGDVISVTLTLL